MSGKITIICATYNAQKTIKAFLSSVRQQTSSAWDLILIDGLSSDNTCKIIEDNRDVVTEYICEADKGIYDAWNKGIKLAKTEWICFVGADDLLRANFIEKYQKVINDLGDERVDYISSKINYIDQQGKTIRTLGRSWIWAEFKNKMTTAHVGSLHNIKLFEEVGLYNPVYKIIGDYELLLRKKDNLKAIFIDEILVDMKAGGVSISLGALKERFKAQRDTIGMGYLRAIIIFFIGLISLLKLQTELLIRNHHFSINKEKRHPLI